MRTFCETRSAVERVSEFKRKWGSDAIERLRADVVLNRWNGMGSRMRAAAAVVEKDILDREIDGVINASMAGRDPRSYKIARAGVHLALECDLQGSIEQARKLITADEDMIPDEVQKGLDSRLFVLESYVEAAAGDQLDFVHSLAGGERAAPECVRKQAAEFLRISRETTRFSAESPKALLKGLLDSVANGDSEGIVRYHMGWSAGEGIPDWWIRAGIVEKAVAFYDVPTQGILGAIVSGDPGVDWVNFDVWSACRCAGIEFAFHRCTGQWYLAYAKRYQFFALEELMFPDDLGNPDVMTFDRLRYVEWGAHSAKETMPGVEERLKALKVSAKRANWDSTESLLDFRVLLWSFAEEARQQKVSDTVAGLLKDPELDIGVLMACVEFAYSKELEKAKGVAKDVMRSTDSPIVLKHLLESMMRVGGEADVAWLRDSVAADDCSASFKRLGTLCLAAAEGQGGPDQSAMAALFRVQKAVSTGDKDAWTKLYRGHCCPRRTGLGSWTGLRRPLGVK